MQNIVWALLALAYMQHEAEACLTKMIKAEPLSHQERQHILRKHNEFRQSVALGLVRGQPAAANMQEMKWDDELASMAQRWAEKCIFVHDQQKDVARFPVGQNMAMTWTTRAPDSEYSANPDFDSQIQKWFNEVSYYGYQRMGPGADGTSHYSQMVWSDTTLVGCGYSYFYDPSRGYTKKYVCNYGPGGNVIGSTPYEVGQPACSKYGLASSKNYQGLCEKSTISNYYQTSNDYYQSPKSYQPPSNYESNTNYQSNNVYQSTNYQSPSNYQSNTRYQSNDVYQSNYQYQYPAAKYQVSTNYQTKYHTSNNYQIQWYKFRW